MNWDALCIVSVVLLVMMYIAFRVADRMDWKHRNERARRWLSKDCPDCETCAARTGDCSGNADGCEYFDEWVWTGK